MHRLLLLLLFAAANSPAHAVDIDGHIHAAEWQGAHHITDFRQTRPLTGRPASLPTQAWVLATPEGLTVAFRLAQPPGVARSSQRVQRDFQAQVDHVSVMIDFDGSGRAGHAFAVSLTGGVRDAVVTEENQFDYGWDGLRKHAVHRDAKGWSVEILIPWYTAPMHKTDGDTRRIGLYLDRVVGSTGERDAWPAAGMEQPRFLSNFRRITVPGYSQPLLAVTPYVSSLYDHVQGQGRLRQGVDVFWKPDSQFQLTGTIHPGFGQAESDDLVVNFKATESFFSEKRAFFTENHGIFDFPLISGNSQLIYTRRMGGASDDGSGRLADINAAVKLNGRVGSTDYGVLSADERGPTGRFFNALRLVHAFDTQSVGMLLTRVEHPWLDREANVLGMDYHWKPDARLTVVSRLVGSDVVDKGKRTTGIGANLQVDYTMDDGWRQQWIAMHFDDRFQVNDFGYLGRNNFDYVYWMVSRRITALPADSIYSQHEWKVFVTAKDNGDGLRLARQFNIARQSRWRNGATSLVQFNVLSARWQDLLTRGHGAVFLPPAYDLFSEYSGTRHGDWSIDAYAEMFGAGLSGNRRIGYELNVEPTWFVNDALKLYLGTTWEYMPDWLVWQHDNLIGSFQKKRLQLDAGFDWSIGNRQELRMKLQAIGLDARLRRAYRVDANGRAVASSEPVDDFSVRNFGLQLRYRYRLAPLSYLYVVYSRGGYAQDDLRHEHAPQLLHNSFNLRDNEQLLVKVNYRFDIL
ncbi:MAG TPA: DUF5916 domain-containing protein [Oleiagrimonas sp.]|nr:DUF5916 domain-containing protein [Oleiagrimonas sp.]